MENSNKDFTQLIAFLSRIQIHIKDSFFAHRFLKKIEHLTAAYIDFKISGSGEGHSVAQYNASKDMKFSLDTLIDLVEYLNKLNLANTTSLLQAQKYLLEANIELTRQIKELATALESIKETGTEKEIISAPVKKSQPKEKPKNFSLNESKSKILEFIKNNPDVRTKDIIKEFNSLSDRTVKRNLTELIKEGIISKRTENKAVFYRPQ
jgi:hypothetical protein